MVGRRSRSPSNTRTRRSPRRSPSCGTRRSRSPTNERSPSYNSQRSSRSPSNSYSSTRRSPSYSSTRRSPYTRRSRSRSRSPRLYSRGRNSRDQFDDSEFYNRNHPSFSNQSERQENSASTRNSYNNSTTSTRSDMSPRDSHRHPDNLSSDEKYRTDPSSIDVTNHFQNDGSFLAMFNTRMEEQKKAAEEKQRLEEQEKKPEKKSSLLYRKIPQKKPKPLATGVRKEAKKQDAADVTSSAWEAYMKEVEAYKTNSCADDDRFSRPLCK